jgi:hypothetical protein
VVERVSSEGYPPSPKLIVTKGTLDLSGRQTTVSEGHQWPPSSNNGFIDIGGDFTTIKQYVGGGNPALYSSVRKPSGSVTYVYDGPFSCPVPTDSHGVVWPVDGSTSDNDLNSLGTTAIARVEPTNSLANLQTFIGETLLDGLPNLPGIKAIEERAKVLKGLSSEFLNFSFGIEPLKADVTDLAKSISHAHQVLQQYMRDSGKMVRRRYEFPDLNEQSEVSLGLATAMYAAGQTNAIDDFEHRGTLTVKTHKSRRRWFSGAFTYYLPVDLGEWSGGSANEADRLLGSRLDLETIWELTPWSWAADWVTNAGDFIHNLDAFANNGLRLRYGYIMEHSIHKQTYSLSGGSGIYQPPGSTLHVPSITLITEVKKRRAATPFGFGFTWEGLSTFQKAIIAALGLSRHQARR